MPKECTPEPLPISYGTLSAPRILTTERRRTVPLRRSLYEVTMAVAVDDLPGYIG
jgi:hypothetical protein